MSKFYGKIGFLETVETVPGVWTESFIEKSYSGEVEQMQRSWQPDGNKLNGNTTINNRISILADPYAYQHFGSIRYIKWMNQSWKVTNIAVNYPRLVLTIGGVYNGEQAESAG